MCVCVGGGEGGVAARFVLIALLLPVHDGTSSSNGSNKATVQLGLRSF